MEDTTWSLLCRAINRRCIDMVYTRGVQNIGSPSGPCTESPASPRAGFFCKIGQEKQ